MNVSYKTIGRNIKAARQALHMTQAQVAEKMDLSLLHFGRLERGDRNVSLSQLVLAADVLGVCVHDLLSGAILDDQSVTQQIADTFSDIPQEDVRLIYELYQVITKQRA